MGFLHFSWRITRRVSECGLEKNNEGFLFRCWFYMQSGWCLVVPVLGIWIESKFKWWLNLGPNLSRGCNLWRKNLTSDSVVGLLVYGCEHIVMWFHLWWRGKWFALWNYLCSLQTSKCFNNPVDSIWHIGFKHKALEFFCIWEVC